MPRTARWSASANYESFHDPYPELREVLSPELAELPPEHIERVMQSLFGAETSAEDLESFWSSLKDFGRVAGGVLQKALPVVGTVAGTVLGGPVGAALGGAAGSALSGALGGALSGPARGAGGRVLGGLASGALSGLGGIAGAFGGGGAGGGGATAGLAGLAGLAGRLFPALTGGGGGAGPIAGVAGQLAPALAAGGGSPAAAQLLRLLTRPEVGQALLSMTLGGAGRRQVAVGNTPVPVGAITNLLGVLANLASAEHHRATAGEAVGTPVYLLDDAGEFLGDPADPVQRAETLLARFAQADALEAAEAAYDESPADEDAEWAQEAIEDLYDELELELARFDSEEEN